MWMGESVYAIVVIWTKRIFEVENYNRFRYWRFYIFWISTINYINNSIIRGIGYVCVIEHWTHWKVYLPQYKCYVQMTYDNSTREEYLKKKKSNRIIERKKKLLFENFVVFLLDSLMGSKHFVYWKIVDQNWKFPIKIRLIGILYSFFYTTINTLSLNKRFHNTNLCINCMVFSSNCWADTQAKRKWRQEILLEEMPTHSNGQCMAYN